MKKLLTLAAATLLSACQSTTPAGEASLDRGPGIDANTTERLRRPFERGNAARSGDGGVGLGLAIVDRIARAHGGQLELLDTETEPRRGLRARLTLPRHRTSARVV